MNTLPPFHVPTKYPGYYWNIGDKCLYSIKIGDELRKLEQHHPHKFNQIREKGYYVSVHGTRRFLSMSYLNDLSLFDTIKDSHLEKKKR